MKPKLLALACLGVIGCANTAFSAETADILFLIDESGSMGGGHEWVKELATTLDSSLNAAGVSNNRFALVGFGANPRHEDGIGGGGHAHQVGSGDWGSASDVSLATSGLITVGGDEDGYDAIDFAFSHYSFRSNAAVNLILITDEDRDEINASLNAGNIQTKLAEHNAPLNVVVNATFADAGKPLLGVDAGGQGYAANGSGGFETVSGGGANSAFGSTIADYVDLAIASGGSAWDLRQLENTGNPSESLTKAFVAVKVNEIVPIPAALPLFGFGAAGLGLFSRKKRQ